MNFIILNQRHHSLKTLERNQADSGHLRLVHFKISTLHIITCHLPASTTTNVASENPIQEILPQHSITISKVLNCKDIQTANRRVPNSRTDQCPSIQT
jgi:hypothetical protein